MKNIIIKNKPFSKIICGTNTFYGRSHFSDAKDVEYQNRFNNDYIEKILIKCSEFGINSIESSANENIINIKKSLLNKNIIMNFIGSTRIDETSEMKNHNDKLSYLINVKSDICLIHAQYVDKYQKNNKINGLKEMIDEIHNNGLIAGISTHYVDIVKICENNNYNIDVYLFPLNITGFVYPGYNSKDTINDRLEIIQNVNKSFIIMKALGAGRIPPNEGLKFVFENIKENDLITLGFGNEYEIEECINCYNKINN
jgi:hypothetical protein